MNDCPVDGSFSNLFAQFYFYQIIAKKIEKLSFYSSGGSNSSVFVVHI